MVLTINNLTGFETGGLEETSSTFGSPDATEATVVRSGIRSLKLPGAASPAQVFIPFNTPVTSAGDNYICGFAVRFTDITPTSTTPFWAGVFTTISNITLKIEATTGDLLLFDRDDLEIASEAAPFTVNTWHYIEVYWFENATTGLAEVFLDGNSIMSVTSQDFRAGVAETYGFTGTVDSGEDIYFDDIYMMTGATAASNRLGDAEVFAYQNDAGATATPDGGLAVT